MNGDVVIIESASNILDAPVAQFAASLTRRGENRKALMDWVRGALVKGTDYGTIVIRGRKSKDSLWKPGAEKICGMLGLKAVFPTLKDYEQAAIDGKPIVNIILRCHLLDGHGNIVADGVGARNAEKENGDLNKALKMAAKSAMIDAVLRCAGLSEVFTQDIEDMGLADEPAPLWNDKQQRDDYSARILQAFRDGETHKVKELTGELSIEQQLDIWRDYDAPTRKAMKADLKSYHEANK